MYMHSNLNIVCVICRGGTRRATEDAAEDRFSNMPSHLRQALMPFQKAGVHFALRREGRLLLADEMGVGKTVQAIAIASCYKVPRHVTTHST